MNKKNGFICYEARPTAQVRLFCFSHAGGGPGAYRVWASELPEDIEVMAFCLPGRGHRLNEPFLKSTDKICSAVLAEMPIDKPYAIFGHSVGALVAYEVAREIEKRRYPPPYVCSSPRISHLICLMRKTCCTNWKIHN